VSLFSSLLALKLSKSDQLLIRTLRLRQVRVCGPHSPSVGLESGADGEGPLGGVPKGPLGGVPKGPLGDACVDSGKVCDLDLDGVDP